MPGRETQPALRAPVAKNPTSAVSVGTTSATVVAANADRIEVTICNDHATQILYLALGATAVVNQGIRLNAAGGSYTTNAYTGIITGVATGATTPAIVVEV